MSLITDPPRTQYNRNLTLKLTGGGSDVVLTFPIKPSEFGINYPARVTTTQTLQGVYQDFGGLGVQTLTYQGSTGWRRKTSTGFLDGFECFKKLYEGIYQEFHSRVSLSLDPTRITCLVIDDLYDKVYQVSLDDFQASKSVSKPLLYSYVLKMTVQKISANGRAGQDDSDLPAVALNKNQIPLSMSEVLNSAATYDPTIYRSYVVVLGDNLQSISFAYFGTKNKAKIIADLNGIVPPYTFNPGIILKIPW